jgi:hypothetical protein
MSNIGIYEVEGAALYFFLELIPGNVHILLVKLNSKCIGSTNKDHSADEHACTNSKIGDYLLIDGLILINIKE